MKIELTREEAEFLAAVLAQLSFAVRSEPEKQLAAMALTVGLIAKLKDAEADASH